MSSIKEWLETEDKDFEAGLALLRKHSRNRNLVNILSRKNNETNRQKLTYELEKLRGLVEEPTDQEPAAACDPLPAADLQPAATGEPAPAGEPGQEAPVPDGSAGGESELDKLVSEMSRLYNARCQKSNTLADCKTDEERAQVAAAIQADQEAYNALAVKKQHFEEHGKFPEEPAPPAAEENVKTKAELLAERGLLRPRVSKAKKAAEKAPADVQKQEKLAKLKLELEDLDHKIKLAQ